MSERCHRGVDRDGTYEPCDVPAMGWAWDDEGGSLYPACEAHAQPVAAELSASLAREQRLREALGEARPYVFNRTQGDDWRAETATDILARVDAALSSSPVEERE